MATRCCSPPERFAGSAAARLDALFFQLYGVNREDAAYILDTFPIVREHDEKAFKRFLTKDLVLANMNGVAAGDLETIVSI